MGAVTWTKRSSSQLFVAGSTMAAEKPLTTLNGVRAEHNIVAAVDGLDSAASLTNALRSAGIAGENIALLGAYPARSDEPTSNESSVEDVTGNDTDPAIRSGNLSVGVHSDDPAQIDLAARTMAGHQKLNVNRFEGEGTVR